MQNCVEHFTRAEDIFSSVDCKQGDNRIVWRMRNKEFKHRPGTFLAMLSALKFDYTFCCSRMIARDCFSARVR